MIRINFYEVTENNTEIHVSFTNPTLHNKDYSYNDR